MVDYIEYINVESIILIIVIIILIIVILSIIYFIIKYILNYIDKSIRLIENFDKFLIFINNILGPIPLSSFQKFLIILCIIMFFLVKLFIPVIINSPSLIVLIAFLSCMIIIFSMGILAFYNKDRSTLEEANLSHIREVGDLYERRK